VKRAPTLIATMERRGLIARQTDTADARAKRLVTTAGGDLWCTKPPVS